MSEMPENINGRAAEIADTISDGINQMASFLRRELILRGILFVLFGILILINPVSVLTAITVAIGVLLLLEGGAMLGAALCGRGKGRAGAIIAAVLFVLLGIFTFMHPLKAEILWITVIGFWQIFSGIQLLFFAGELRGGALFSGLLSILAGVLLITLPLCGVVTLGWLIGAVSLVSGIAAIVFSFKLKTLTR